VHTTPSATPDSVQIKDLLAYLMSDHEKAQYQDNVTVLCISLPCLRDLGLESFPARAAFMVGLALHSSLTCLNIIIKEGSLGLLPLINKLQNLKELTIKIDEDQSELFPLNQPIIRPLMIKFSLIVIDDIDAVTLMNYLALCRVHPSCQVLLDLECTSNPIEFGMLLFLKAHTFCKVELCLKEHQCSYLGNWGKVLDPLSHVVFTGSIPFSRIPCKLPKVVELQVNSGTYDNEHLTWDFLDQALKQCTQVPGQSSTIRILREAGSQPMRWTITNPNDDGEPMFTGRLLRHARLLYDHGVYVVDQGWEDVRGMVRAPSQPCVCGPHQIGSYK
jgi:hypothetical protein